jgi:peroxiredoxin
MGIVVLVGLAGCGKSNAEGPAPAPVAETGAQAAAAVGKPAPGFTLKDLDGKEHTLASFAGKTVVLEWFNPDCPFVVRSHKGGPLESMARDQAKNGVVWLAINSGSPGKQGTGVERNKAALTEYGLAHPVLLDESGAVGKLYGARNTPGMYIVDKAGVLVYAGALDNAPSGKPPEEGYRNYVAEALADLAAGRPVKVAETKAYGCSVKYAD